MEETKYTYCRICEPNCGLMATVTDGKLTRLSSDKKHPISRGFICPRGLATLDIHNDPDRLKYPVKKINGEWRTADWSDAISDIGARLKAIREKYGKDAVGMYFGNPIAFDCAFSLYMPYALLTMDTHNVFSAGSQDCNNKFAAAQRVYGSPVLHPVPDIEKIDFLIIFGSNPAVSQMSFISLARPLERLRNIAERGGRVIIIDPRRTETAREVGEHIFIRPDTDIYLLLAMIHVIVSEELYDKETVANHTRGIEDLAKLAAEYPPKRAAKVTGIPKDAIKSLARDFAAAKNAGIHGSLGINLGTFGTLDYWLIQCLNTLTGRLDRRGSMLFCEGLVDAPGIYHKISKSRRPGSSRIGDYPAVMDTMPAGVMADEILTTGKGQIKALIVVSGNPMLTVPDPDKLARALKSLDLLVSLDFFVNETGAMGDYVLACKDFYERWDFTWTSMFFNPVRFVNYTRPVVEPDGQKRDSWAVMHDILKASGYKMAGSGALTGITKGIDAIGKLLKVDEPLSFRPKLMLRAALARSEVSWKQLMASRQGIMLKDHGTGTFFSKRLLTPDKRVNLAPTEFMAEANEVEKFYKQERDYEGLKLIGQRRRRTHNSWFGNVESLAKKEVENFVYINPKDASELGIEEGAAVVVKSDSGSVKIKASLSEDLMPGTVSIPHGWGHDMPSGLTVAQKYPGVNVNRLMASGAGSLEKFAGMARLTGVRVSVKKAKNQPEGPADRS